MGEDNLSYVEYLAEQLNKQVDYSEYCDPEPAQPIEYAEYVAEHLSFPVVQQVSARTLGFDLVEVQPMGAPVGNMIHMDITFEYIPLWDVEKKYDPEEFFNDNTFDEY